MTSIRHCGCGSGQCLTEECLMAKARSQVAPEQMVACVVLQLGLHSTSGGAGECVTGCGGDGGVR